MSQQKAHEWAISHNHEDDVQEQQDEREQDLQQYEQDRYVSASEDWSSVHM